MDENANLMDVYKPSVEIDVGRQDQGHLRVRILNALSFLVLFDERAKFFTQIRIAIVVAIRNSEKSWMDSIFKKCTVKYTTKNIRYIATVYRTQLENCLVFALA